MVHEFLGSGWALTACSSSSAGMYDNTFYHIWKYIIFVDVKDIVNCWCLDGIFNEFEWAMIASICLHLYKIECIIHAHLFGCL